MIFFKDLTPEEMKLIVDAKIPLKKSPLIGAFFELHI